MNIQFSNRRLTRRRVARRGGFSLVELLVVIGIIVLIASASVPAFRFITGARSTDAAVNIASAMLARARSQAVTDHRGTGVFFFLDRLTDRTTMALVHQGEAKLADPDFIAYRGWTDGQGQYTNPRDANIANQAVTYRQGTGSQEADFTINLQRTAAPVVDRPFQGVYTKLTETSFDCIRTHNAATGRRNAGPNAGSLITPNPWGKVTPGVLDLVAGSDFERLPMGVGAQLINDPTPGATAASTVANRDRYLRTGVLMFDRTGRLVNVTYDVLPATPLGQALFLPGAQDTRPPQTLGGQSATAATPTGASKNFFSQFGLVVYDREVFRNATATVSPTNATVTFKPSEGDFMTNGVLTSPAGPGATYAPNEQAEEWWLDQNALPLMVDRFTGALIKGE